MVGICDLNRKTYCLKKILKSKLFYKVPLGINKDYALNLSSFYVQNDLTRPISM